MRLCCAALAIVLLVAAASWGQTTGAVLYEGARLIAGDGSTPIEDGALLVEGGRIRSVGRRSDVRAPEGVTRVDLRGKTIIPSLVTLHGHVGYLKGGSFSADNYTRDNIVDHLQRYLYYGVAAVMSTGTDPGELPYRLRSEEHPGALFRTAGRGIAAPNASTGNLAMRGVAYGVTTEQEARAAVRELAAQRADFVKIWVDDRGGTVQKLTPALSRAIIGEAHAHNLRVMAHVYYLADAHDLVDAGIDGFLHLVRDREMDDALVRQMKEKRVFVTPNLGTAEAGTYRGAPTWLNDPALAETVGPSLIRQVSDFYVNRPAPAAAAAESYAAQRRSLAKLNAAGVPIALGNDTGIERTFFGYGEHRELELMTAAGMTPIQVLVAATRTPAELLRLDRLGSLSPGKDADFIVLDANPLDGISNTKRIAAVYQRGRQVDRAGMRAAWR